MKWISVLSVLFSLVLCCGCGSAGNLETPDSSDGTATEAANTASGESVSAEATEADAGKDASANAENAEANDSGLELELDDADTVENSGGEADMAGGKADSTDGNVKKAEAGVTHKGEFAHSSDHPMSIIDVPLATYFTAQEKAVFDIQIPQAMNLYKATNGEFPKTEKEFMSEIIQNNQIHLPELKEGDEYFYDPKQAQLMVRTRK